VDFILLHYVDFNYNKSKLKHLINKNI